MNAVKIFLHSRVVLRKFQISSNCGFVSMLKYKTLKVMRYVWTGDIRIRETRCTVALQELETAGDRQKIGRKKRQ